MNTTRMEMTLQLGFIRIGRSHVNRTEFSMRETQVSSSKRSTSPHSSSTAEIHYNQGSSGQEFAFVNSSSSPGIKTDIIMNGSALHSTMQRCFMPYYMRARFTSLLQGGKDSEDSVYRLGKTLEKVKDRLQSGHSADDSTIAAFSCIALGEVCLDLSIKPWSPKSMAYSYAWYTTNGELTRHDVIFSDYYTGKASSRNHIHSMRDSSKAHRKRQHLTIFYQSIQIASLSNILLDPKEFSNDIYWIEYELLSFPSSIEGSHESGLDKATRIGALVFEFPHSTTSPSILLQQLQAAPSTIDTAITTDQILQWLTWLFTIGAVHSKRESITRTWFMEQLAGLHMERLESLLVET
ncbi:hypothetical protein SBOR_5769 [Sclerotinia borealis F-4128]|uniref:Uncharacterized protein n=1 Tax=Sclerotinia borealis (strain F-4128) TaxID=1432307 RepID=W9CDC3_SCLBF|nr:hypothetical protein SBOR_5769 [Sclerotinia borealis F-4128]